MSDNPNLIWITLDSLRYDHTSMAGYGRDTTPNLQRIADRSEGRTFSECIAHGNWTLSSSTSILTGTYPSHHTVGLDESTKLTPKLRTVAELLKERGYATACLSDNTHVSDATGLSRGFDRFSWLSSSTLLETAGVKSLAKYALNVRKHSAGFTLDDTKHATPFLMNEVGTRWLDDLRNEEPFFFYLHYNEPHRPYYPPLPYLDRYTDDLDVSTEEAAEISMEVHENLYEIVANGCDLSETEWGALHAMYDAEIAYTDEMVGRLFDHVRSLDLDDTIFVVTADHGELFGEYGLLAHKLCLHDAIINVPLVVHGPTDVTDADDLVQHADLMRTFVEAAGGSTEQLQGVDLREEAREHTIAQRGGASFESLLKYNPDFDTDRYHEPMLNCLRTDEFKYQTSGERSELFALPDEETDVQDRHPETTAALGRRLDEWLETDGQPVDASREAEFTDAMERQLRDLGYVD